jgi:formylglycine-generating enzyme required for sulfatase activity
VGAGAYVTGSGKNNDPLRRMKLPYTFWVTTYPVTYAQYRPFVDDGGYDQPEFWSKDSWLWKRERTYPDLVWDDYFWHISNHPVVGITWFEAMAYCQWLTQKITTLQQSGQDMNTLGWSLPPDHIIRLPTSAEWEKAARGTDGRVYPYGDEFILENNNVTELNLGRTSAVGIFPEGSSPFGVQDMAGNVWEWCLSGWKKTDDLTTIDLNASNGSRSYKGGSWNADQAAAQSYIRFKQKPAQRSRKVGFRLCIGPHSF